MKEAQLKSFIVSHFAFHFISFCARNPGIKPNDGATAQHHEARIILFHLQFITDEIIPKLKLFCVDANRPLRQFEIVPTEEPHRTSKGRNRTKNEQNGKI
jgi:hypothetical protein